jgi:hypothetical protein
VLTCGPGADTLPSRGPSAYSVFLAALRRNYSWLAEELEGGCRYSGTPTVAGSNPGAALPSGMATSSMPSALYTSEYAVLALLMLVVRFRYPANEMMVHNNSNQIIIMVTTLDS